MKKIITLLLVAVMCLALVACNNGSGNTETPPSGENTENNGSVTNDNTTNKDDKNDENTTTEPEKIERGTVTTSENPLLPILFQTIIKNGWEYHFKEDGTCSDTDFWWIYSDESDRLAIYITDEYQYKYNFVIFAGGTVAYDEAYYHEGSLNWMPGYKNIKPIDKKQ